LLRDGASSGAWNMAVDEAMLWAHARDLAPPTLRFYAWQPHCLSLGRLQKEWPRAATDAGFDIVRRPTGGRAVWHAREITYCAVVRAELLPPEARSVAGAYRWLSDGFLSGLTRLGLPVEMAPTGVRTAGSNCFAASAGCDFVAEGKKLIGAAQFRQQDTILQHGSLLLEVDEAQWAAFAGGPMAGATSLSALDSTLDAEVVTEALIAGFWEKAGGSWENEKLSARETRLANRLVEKYRDDAWTSQALVAPGLLEGIENALK
jgi:lipoate-protein ligase A